MHDYALRDEALAAAGLAPDIVAGAAFFDLDRTLLRRSSALALAGSFRERGLISRRQLAKAALWQLLFALRGASHEAVRRGAEDGLIVLRGSTPEEHAVARRRGARAGAAAARLRRAAAAHRAAQEARRAGVHRLRDAAGDRPGDRGRPRLRRRARHASARCATACTRAARCVRCMRRTRRRRHPGAGGSGGLRPRRVAPRTPTVTRIFRSSRRSGIPSSSIRTGSCGGSRRRAAGRCSSSARARTRMRGGACRRRCCCCRSRWVSSSAQ